MQHSLDAQYEPLLREKPAGWEHFVDDLDALIGVSAGEVSQRPPPVTPDAYSPSTPRGSEALAILAEKFGRFASVPPPRANTDKPAAGVEEKP